MSTFGERTGKADDTTARSAVDAPCLALVIVWSASQPHRVGEVALFPLGELLIVGGGDVDVENLAHFVRQ